MAINFSMAVCSDTEVTNLMVCEVLQSQADIGHSLVLQEQLQEEGLDDWHLITLGLTVRGEISCLHLHLLLLCEHCVDEHPDQIWFRS